METLWNFRRRRDMYRPRPEAKSMAGRGRQSKVDNRKN